MEEAMNATEIDELNGCKGKEEFEGSGVSHAQAVVITLMLSPLVFTTMLGNCLVVLSVFTHRPLRIVQNCFIVSLAIADLAVASLVMPLNLAYFLLDEWVFGIYVCKLWLTCDVLCCTASILNLCAIALDRYWAITDPINYAQKRTFKRVMMMIVIVWILSAAISSPPLAGWNDWPEEFGPETPCQLTSRQGYVIYSALGSFYIPLLVMTLVYLEIYLATRRRLRERAEASRLGMMPSQRQRNDDADDSGSSDANHHESRSTPRSMMRPVVVDDEQTEISTAVTTTTQSRRPAGATTATTTTTTTVYQFIKEKQKISLSKERRAARTLGVIMGAFVICWLPFFLMYVIVPFCDSCCPSNLLVHFITWLGYLNSTLNPIIYTIFNADFRDALRKLLRFR